MGRSSRRPAWAPLVAGALFAATAQAAPVCAPGQTDVAPRPTPVALVPRLAKAFGMTARDLAGASYVRCADGRLLGCAVGANLDCGKADTRRSLAGADAFCRENTDAAVVPMAATGHGTVYAWRCVGTRGTAGDPMQAVDANGYLKINWIAVP